MRLGTVAGLLVLTAVTACTDWYQDRQALEAPPPDDRPVQLWSHGHSQVVHHLTIRGDSVYAASGSGEADGDTSRVAMARSAIDSVCIARFSPGRTTMLGVVALVILADLAIHAAFGGPGS